LHVIDAPRDDAEVEEFVRVDVVEEAVAGAPFVGEEGVLAGGVDGVVFPLGDVIGGCGGEVLGVGGGTNHVGDTGHGLDTDYAFDG